MFRKAHVDFECFSFDTIFHHRDILVSTKPWSLFLEIFGGHKCENQPKNLSQRVTSVPVPRFQGINRMDYYGCSRFQKSHGHPYLWTSLWTSKGFDSIFVVVDRLTKMAHFVPCNKTVTGEETVRLFIDNVYKYHGLPDDIISDRGTQFTSKFWQSLFKILQVEIKLSSAYHLQTDGQTERVNQVLEQYLRCSINYHQNNWVDLLPLAEFAYNNTIQDSTKQTPFFVNYGHHPRFDQFQLYTSKNLAAEDLATRLLEIQKDTKIKLLEAQKCQKQNADKSRKQHPPIHVGDKVWLLHRNLKTHRPSDKFDYRRLGPFSIIKQVNEVAYRLELPPSMKIHPIFHVSLFELYKDSTIPGRLQAPPPPIEVDGAEEFEVSEILDSRINRRKLDYLVHWQGYEVHERTWERAANLENAPEMIAEFHQEYPSKPKNV